MFSGRVVIQDRDKLERLKEAGATRVGFGVEPGDQKFGQQVLRRKMTNKQILEVSQIAKEVGLQVKTLKRGTLTPPLEKGGLGGIFTLRGCPARHRGLVWTPKKKDRLINFEPKPFLTPPVDWLRNTRPSWLEREAGGP